MAVEKAESLVRNVEDKETTEADGKKLPEKEVSPFYFHSSALLSFLKSRQIME